MNNHYTALEGKSFSVELLSNIGSTNYGWCLTEMPKEIILIGTEIIPIEPIMSGSRALQRFHFGVKSSENAQVSLQFELVCMSDIKNVSDTYTAEVQIVACNSDEYARYSENEEQEMPTLKYGYPCTVAYGYPSVKYGYPCVSSDQTMPYVAYGYPCAAPDQTMPYVAYGYPCGMSDAMSSFVKYGYPCASQDAMPPFVKYGYPCMVAYGYPNGGCGLR